MSRLTEQPQVEDDFRRWAQDTDAVYFLVRVHRTSESVTILRPDVEYVNDYRMTLGIYKWFLDNEPVECTET